MSTPNCVAIEQDSSAPFPRIHCPVCGHATTEVINGDASVTPNPCPHLQFIYICDATDFEYRSPAFSEKAGEIDFSDLSEVQQALEQAGYGSSFLALAITHGGVACGPVWSTDIYGFEFAAGEKPRRSTRRSKIKRRS